MKEFKIEVPNGYEIDKEKSTFEKIVFKEVNNEKYPTKLRDDYPSSTLFFLISSKYGNKLELLDKLLIARDEWNEINGFEADWKDNNKPKHSITPDCDEFFCSLRYTSRRIFSFKTKETAQLFLDTFRKELEEIKEFI